MKTIEEKAEAYDRAIERAKKQLDGAKVFDYKEKQIAHDIRTTTYAIFPELKESEDDEIMIRQLTEYFTTGKGLQNTNETVVEWLNDIKEKLSHVERKQKWSEEDDKKLKDCIYAIKNTYYVGCDELIH